MDKIHIRDLLVRCILGTTPLERKDRQDVLLDLTLHVDARPAAATDRLEDAVDYRALTKQVLQQVESSEHVLVETLADAVARTCLEHRGVAAVEVRVEKPGALRFARSVGVEILRGREG
jgi:FolB domain-containing protein